MNPLVRRPAVAGRFYTANATHLRQEIKDYLAAADPGTLRGVRAVIAPHAGYIYSGPTAAFAYKALLAAPVPRRIYLLGPSHHLGFTGVALGDYDVFQTPLGDVPVDRVQIQQLLQTNPLFQVLNSPHIPEHCLEVQLPFLQVIYSATPPVLPLLFGHVDPDVVGRALASMLEPDDLIIVSSDLSHYHSEETAQILDHRFLDALLGGDLSGVAMGEACGQAPALALMACARERQRLHGSCWTPHLLDYRTSAAASGDYHQVVGYAAVAYIEEGA